MPSAIGAATGLLAFLGLLMAIRRFSDWVAQFMSEVVGKREGVSDEGVEDMDVDDDVYGHEDSVFLVHALVNDVAREMFKEIRSTIIEVYAPDTLMVYPEPDGVEEEEGLYGAGEPDGVEAVIKGERLTVKLDARYFSRLAEIVERGEGEVAVVDGEEELRVVYDVAKTIAGSAIDDDAFAAYTAYKALLRMIRSRRLAVPERLRDLLPFEDRDLRIRVRQQVAEEG